jgi:cytochrome c oxidase subunit I+III
MPRRIFTYYAELNVAGLNLMSTIGAYTQAVSVLLLFFNVIKSLRAAPTAGPNPWGGATLEWATTSPPVEHNFNRIPTVHSREPLWVEAAQVEDAARGTMEPNIHMPPPSYWPIFTAFGATLTFALFLTAAWWPPLIGLAWTAIGVINWAYEPIH